MRFLNNLKLIVKLAIPAVIIMAITIGLVAIAKNGLDSLSADTRELAEVEAVRLATILKINSEVNEASIQEKNLIIYSSADVDKLASAEKVYGQYKALALQHVDELIALPSTPERRAMNEGVKATVAGYFTVMDKSVAFAVKDQDAAALQISNGEGRDLRIKVRNLLKERTDANEKGLVQAGDEAEALAASTSTLLIASSAGGILLAITLLGSIVVFAVVRPLNGMTGAMGRLAAGDLDVSVTGT
ncbi:MCP four helix bundle domain-containing protein, partial [Microvirga splendida]